jgi:3-hydroxyisobutyrate dehydrogenase-like beta-hydroxyacid dehydrogenase
MTQTIGFIGLGAMGLPMAQRLAAAGYTLVVYDLDAAALEQIRTKDRVSVAGGPDAVAEQCELLFTCMPNVQAAQDVYRELGQHELLACDCSTIGPRLAEQMHNDLRRRGIRYVECPMLGGVDEAAHGQLFFIVSGVAADLPPLPPLFAILGREYRYVGGPGHANRIKVVQNGLGLVQLAAIAEALTMLAKDGADLQQFCEIVAAGHGMADTPLFRARAPKMLETDPPAKGKLRIGAKDIGLACQFAEQLQLDAPLFQQAQEVFQQALTAGLSETDTSQIARVLEQRAGVSLVTEKP